MRWRTYLVPGWLFALIGLTAAAAADLEDGRGLPGFAAIGLGIGATLPAALAVRSPLWAWRVGYPMLYLGVLGASPRDAWPWNAVQILGFLFLLAVLAARADPGVAAWAGALTLVPLYLFVGERANAHGAVVLIVVVLIVGDQVRRRRQSQRALAEQTELSELEKARRAILEERTRIARELHDVVAHHMSMIAVQAETAPYRLAALPEPARVEFAAIAGSARGALTEMRRLLGVLRSDAEEVPTAPQPRLADLRHLVDAAGRAGMAVRLDPLPEGASVEAPLGLAAYRIVQEALANAARHAPGAPVRVTVERAGGRLHVRIRNGPATVAAAPAPDVGHGLSGMRERAVLLGGDLAAVPTPDGGFAVSASFPEEAS